MNIYSTTLGCVALAGILAGPAHAQLNVVTNPVDGSVTVYLETGGIIRKTVTDPKLVEMMTMDAMPMATGVMMMMHNGKMYTIPDKKMPSGKMLSDEVMAK